MREWRTDQIARAAGAELLGRAQAPGSGPGLDAGPGPARATIDSREVASGDLFVGLRGEQVDGGAYAEQALQAGAWGVLVAPEHARGLAGAGDGSDGVVLASEDPLQALQDLANAWLGELREQGAKVVGITGSTGKTSTKDILAALLEGAGRRTVASPENRNTEIGLPLTVLEAPAGTEVLVLEMAMRGAGQIAELAEIARPDVGVIVNVGPVHLEQLGSLEGVAAAKAELIAGLEPGGTAVVPADEPLLDPYRREDVRTVTFGPGGDVRLGERKGDGSVAMVDGTEEMVLRPAFRQEHNLRNLEAAVAAARALGVTPAGEVRVRFSKMRGERTQLPGGVELIEDCYNANPMSMRAAIDDLLGGDEPECRHNRAVAVLGDMLELGPEELRYHRELGEYAAAKGVDVLVAVGPRASHTARAFAGAGKNGETHTASDADAAAELLKHLLAPGDAVLIKGSRAVGLERVAQGLAADERAPALAQTAER